MSAPDYSQRDKAVRHNIYASVRRRDGLPHELFATYWRDVHSTLCSRLPGLGFYVQQHFDRNHTANLWPIADGVRPIRAVLDGSAELGFANIADQKTFAEAGTILYGDEANFIGEAIAYALPNGSQTYVDREEDGTRNGPDRYHRVHVYMNRKPGADASAWLSETSADLARSEAVQKWKLHLPEPYSNDRPAPPSPNVAHFVEDARLNLAIAEVAFVSARAAREFFSTPAFQKILGRQSTYIDALGAYLVTGFYTFVRDGRPTTAGLRGSRSAELIEAAGAANQLEPAVATKFLHART
jgi:EthD domain